MNRMMVKRPSEGLYEDEPIELSAEKQKSLTPKEYRTMRRLNKSSPFDRSSQANIFYLQAKLMEHFEDDCPWHKPVFCFTATYTSMTIPELRGYFTWRTQLRHGHLIKADNAYVDLYFTELIHNIGSATVEEGFTKLMDFYLQYREIDPATCTYVPKLLVDYAIYYGIPSEQVRPYFDATMDEAVVTLSQCDTADDEALMQALMRLSPYRLDRSKAYKQQTEALAAVVCDVYRKLNAMYSKRYARPYTYRLFGGMARILYKPFRTSVFFDHKPGIVRQYQLTPLHSFDYERNCWHETYFPQGLKRSPLLGEMVKTIDSLFRAAYGIKPALQPASDSVTLKKIILETIEEQKQAARRKAAPVVQFNLSLLDNIRQSSDTTAEKLMTEEERWTEPEPAPAPQPAETSDCLLSGHELRFMQVLLSGGDWRSYLSANHLMASVLAESINEQLYDTFADTVIEFDGDTPVLVEDYLDDLKGMIPS